MAEAIKKLGSFSVDALYNELSHRPLSDTTLQELTELASRLTKPVVAKSVTMQRDISDKEAFDKIVKDILNDVGVFQRESSDLVLQDITAMKDPFKMSLAEIVVIHREVSLLETSIEKALLLTKYFRGFLYIAAHTHINEHAEFKDWLFNNFKVSYRTARRYMAVSLLLKSFPMLLVCNISFGTLQKYNKMLRAYFKGNEKMQESLTVLNSRGELICYIEQKNNSFLPEGIPFTPEFHYKDPTELSDADLTAFKRLKIAKSSGSIPEDFFTGKDAEDDILDK